MKKVIVSAAFAGMMLMVSGCSSDVDVNGSYVCKDKGKEILIDIIGDRFAMFADGQSLRQRNKNKVLNFEAVVKPDGDDFTVEISGIGGDGKAFRKELMSFTPKDDGISVTISNETHYCSKNES